MKKIPSVSLIVPIYNEGKYIEQFLNSLRMQSYPVEKMQIILVEGRSQDQTLTIIQNFINNNEDLDILLLDNEKRYQVYALNLGIKHASGDIIIRLDAHSRFPENYIELCIKTLFETGADNVGGLANTKGTTNFSKTVAKLLSSKFGVGNSEFRIHAKSGYVDTVPFGTYRKELFDQIGLFDERLIRNEDNEFNARILKNGGTIYLNSEIQFDYYCRDTFRGLVESGYMNGQWNIITLYLTKGSMRVRHFVPFLFFLYIIIGLAISIPFPDVLNYWFVILALYIFLDFIVSIKISKTIKEFVHLFFLFPSFHITYGFGSFIGLFKIIFGKTEVLM